MLKRLIPAGLAIAAGVAAFLMPHPITYQGIGIGDIGPPMFGFQQFLNGASPYSVSLRAGPLSAYPFTTMLVMAPFLILPVPWVAAAFCALVTYLLAESIVRTEPLWRLLIFLSPSFLTALHSVQWSPLMTAALLLPSLLPFAVAKPQLGIVLAAAGRWSRTTVIVTAAILLLSLALFPSWPVEWLRRGNLGIYLGRSPLFLVPGFLILLALARWRSRDARIVLALSIVLQRFFYDQLPLFLTPKSWQQMTLLLATSWSAVLVSLFRHWWIPASGDQHPHAWTAVILGFYLPATALVLWNNRKATV